MKINTFAQVLGTLVTQTVNKTIELGGLTAKSNDADIEPMVVKILIGNPSYQLVDGEKPFITAFRTLGDDITVPFNSPIASTRIFSGVANNPALVNTVAAATNANIRKIHDVSKSLKSIIGKHITEHDKIMSNKVDLKDDMKFYDYADIAEKVQAMKEISQLHRPFNSIRVDNLYGSKFLTVSVSDVMNNHKPLSYLVEAETEISLEDAEEVVKILKSGEYNFVEQRRILSPKELGLTIDIIKFLVAIDANKTIEEYEIMHIGETVIKSIHDTISYLKEYITYTLDIISGDNVMAVTDGMEIFKVDTSMVDSNPEIDTNNYLAATVLANANSEIGEVQLLLISNYSPIKASKLIAEEITNLEDKAVNMRAERLSELMSTVASDVSHLPEVRLNNDEVKNRLTAYRRDIKYMPESELFDLPKALISLYKVIFEDINYGIYLDAIEEYAAITEDSETIQCYALVKLITMYYTIGINI